MSIRDQRVVSDADVDLNIDLRVPECREAPWGFSSLKREVQSVVEVPARDAEAGSDGWAGSCHPDSLHETFIVFVSNETFLVSL